MNKFYLLLSATSMILGSSFSAWAEDDTVTLHIAAKGKVFTPKELTAPAGKRIEIMVKNEGPASEEFDSSDLKREKVIAEGQTAKVTLGVLKPGKYKFRGEFRGSEGVLNVLAEKKK